MASTIDTDAYSNALVFLGTAGVVVPVVRRFGLSPILGYLGAGAILGPLGLGSFSDQIPVLYWFTVSDAASVGGIAELGIVFLLFLIGLELSFHRLLTMRRLVVGLGGSQVLLTSAVIAGALALSGRSPPEAIVLGASLSLSSTAIVLELLSNQERLTTRVGRASFSVLLAQDLAVIPILLFISIVAGRSGGSVLASLANALLQAAVAIVAIVAFGRVLLRPLFRLVATARSDELFIAAALFVVVGAGVIAAEAGLSMALGAFVAGLLLAETEYHKAVEATVAPVKGLLLGMFFFTVGMSIDFREVVREPVLLLGGVVGLIAIKGLLLTGLGRLFRLSWPVAVETGLLLGPGGEFAFVGIGMAKAAGLIDARFASFALAVTAVTMALTPLLSVGARHLSRRLRPHRAIDPELAVRPGSGQRQAIVVGYGRVGKMVCSLLREHGISYIAADFGCRDRGPRPPRRSRGLLRRRRRRALSRDLRPRHGGRRHHHGSLAQHHRPGRRARPRDAARHHRHRACARCRSRPPSVRARRHRCRARDGRSEPAAFGGGARRPRRRHGAGDRLDPRKARRDPPHSAAGGRWRRSTQDSCGKGQDPQGAGRGVGGIGAHQPDKIRPIPEVRVSP